MTEQEPDVFIENGTKFETYSYLLEKYFENHPRPPIGLFRTSMIRGYIATWTLIGEKLYLSQIKGYIDADHPLTLDMIFPNTVPPIFVEWYSGSMFIRHGKLFRIGGSFNLSSEHLEEIYFKKGVLIKREMKKYDEKSGKYVKME